MNSSSQLISVHEGYLLPAETPTYSGLNSFHLSNTLSHHQNNQWGHLCGIRHKRTLRMHCIHYIWGEDASYHPLIWYGTTQPLNTSTQTDRKWGNRGSDVTTAAAGIMVATTNHETSLATLREMRWVRSLSAHNNYKSKENTARASHLICHPERQAKYPGKPFPINPGCVSCLKPHARLHTQDWQRGLLLAPSISPWLLTRWYIRTRQSQKDHLKEPGLPPSQASE